MYDAFDTFGLLRSRRKNNNEDDDLFYADSFDARAPSRRHRMTGGRPTGSRPARPLGDMAAQPSTGDGGGALWAGWDTGQSDDGTATGNTPSSLLDAEHPLKKYRRRKNGRRSGRRSRNNRRNRAGRVLDVTTTMKTTTTTTAPPANPVNCVDYSAVSIRTKYYIQCMYKNKHRDRAKCGWSRAAQGPKFSKILLLRSFVPHTHRIHMTTRNQYASPPEGNAIPAERLFERFLQN